MNCIKNLKYIIDYCEDNLCHEMSIDELASKAGYSMFYFCRLFQSVTGYAPKEYMRKRRLSQAAVELYNTNAYIRDIGFKWGFNSHENFERAFRKQFGVSPSQYRKCRSSLNLFHRIERIENRFEYNLGLIPEFIDRPSFKLAGFSCRTTWKDGANKTDAPKLWNNYHGRKLYDRIGIHTDPISRYDIGMITECDFEKSRFTYIIGIEVDDFKKVNGECAKMIVPAAHYAVFKTPPADTHTFVKNIHMTWDFIYTFWFPQTGFKHMGTHEFETYCEESRSYSEEIWIPIIEGKYES